MCARIEQAALLELTLDLDQAVAEAAQQADRNRLVVDERAAAPIRAQDPAQHQIAAVGSDPVFGQDGMGRVVRA